MTTAPEGEARRSGGGFAEQDRRYDENEKRHKAALIKVLTDLEMARLDVDAITAQLAHLLDHLMAARVVDPDELDEEPQLDVRWSDKEAGVAVVAVWIEGIVYYEHPATGVIYAERKQGGGIEQSIVSDDDGSFGRWHRSTPRPWKVPHN
jgi:hypothetical protein